MRRDAPTPPLDPPVDGGRTRACWSSAFRLRYLTRVVRAGCHGGVSEIVLSAKLRRLNHELQRRRLKLVTPAARAEAVNFSETRTLRAREFGAGFLDLH